MDTPGRIAELERKFADNPRRYFAALANEFRKHGELDRAIELCETHLADQRNHLSGHVVLAQALIDAGRESDAWDPLHTALDIDPENFIALRLIGELSAGVGDIEHARTYFFRALEIEPRNEQILTAVKNLTQRPVPAEPERLEPTGAAASWGDVELLSGPEATAAHDAEAAAEPVAEEPHVDGPAVEESPVEESPVWEAPVWEAPVWEAPVEEPPIERPPVEEPPVGAPAVDESPEPGGVASVDSAFEDWLPPLVDDIAEASAPNGRTEPVEPEPGEARPVLASETMADLYEQQGHLSLAVDVLRELVASRPQDERLRGRLADLERAAAVPPRQTVRDMFAQFARAAEPLRGRSRAGSRAHRVTGNVSAEPGPLADFFATTPTLAVSSRSEALLAMVAPAEPAPSEDDALGRWLSDLRAS